jgi:hypothetical protein
MNIKLKLAKPAPEEPELLPALEPSPDPRPRRAQSSVPHVSPYGIIKEPQPFWPRLLNLLRREHHENA